MATRMSESPAPVQITVEQILHEAREISRQEDAAIREIKHEITDSSEDKITDSSELSDYKLRRRKKFEKQIRLARPKSDYKLWIKYALWEDSQKEYARASSVFERALEADFRYDLVWIKYAEMEMKNNFIKSARNVWERAVTYFPREDILWVKYILMEKNLGNIAGARQIFERWINLSPDPLDYSGKIFERWRNPLGYTGRTEAIERSFKKQKVEEG